MAIPVQVAVQSARVVHLPFEVFAATLFELGVRVARVVAFVAPAALVVLGEAPRLAGDRLQRSGFACRAFGWWQGAYLALHRVQ